MTARAPIRVCSVHTCVSTTPTTFQNGSHCLSLAIISRSEATKYSRMASRMCRSARQHLKLASRNPGIPESRNPYHVLWYDDVSFASPRCPSLPPSGCREPLHQHSRQIDQSVALGFGKGFSRGQSACPPSGFRPCFVDCPAVVMPPAPKPVRDPARARRCAELLGTPFRQICTAALRLHCCEEKTRIQGPPL